MLTDAAVRAAKPKERDYKLNDTGGLLLVVTKGGSKLWRMRYVIQGKEKLLSFGPYPEVSLVNARDQRDAARALLRDGKDPSLQKKIRRALNGDLTNTFEVCFGMEKGPLWRGDRRPKGTPLVMGFTMALVFGGGLGWDAGSGNGREDTAGLFCSGQGDQGDLPGAWGLPESGSQGSAVGGDRVSL